MKHFKHSVRKQLLLWYSALQLVILLLFSLLILIVLKTALNRHLQTQLELDFSQIEQIIQKEPDEIDEIDEFSPLRLFIISKNGEIESKSRAWKASKLVIPPKDQFGIFSQTSPDNKQYTIKSGIVQKHYILTVAADNGPIQTVQKFFIIILLILLPAAMGLTAASGYFLSGRLLRPVSNMAKSAAHISFANLSQRLYVHNPHDEFGILATVFNNMLDRLQNAILRLRQFTADASHELRTPLTVIKSVGEVTLQEDPSPEVYRDRIGSMLEETERLSRLVDNLLTLTRADSSNFNFNPQKTLLNEFLFKIIQDYRILAEEKRQTITIDFDPEKPITGVVDEDLLKRAVVNLLDNAIKYTPNKGKITIKLVSTDKLNIIKIKDTGPGIPQEHFEKIFERFYRVSKARSRELGGTGLGLAIAKWAVEMNNGSVFAANDTYGGTIFCIELYKN